MKPIATARILWVSFHSTHPTSYSSIMSNISFKKIQILTFFPILFFCHSCCRYPYDSTQYNCNKCNSIEFSSCIKKNFPVSSSYTDLSNYLTAIGLVRSKDPDIIKENRFYFRWKENNFLTPYGVIVFGRYNNKLQIIEIGAR